ncbi:Calcium/calmodulin-dependent 3', partial [Nibea albiflora]
KPDQPQVVELSFEHADVHLNPGFSPAVGQAEGQNLCLRVPGVMTEWWWCVGCGCLRATGKLCPGASKCRRGVFEKMSRVANEDAESSTRPQASFARSKSQSALWNAITAGMGIKGKEQKPPLNDPRSPEEILADDLPAADEPDATEKTAIRFAAVMLLQQ